MNAGKNACDKDNAVRHESYSERELAYSEIGTYSYIKLAT